MVIRSNIFISDISVDNLNGTLNLYKADNINNDIIMNDYSKQNSMAYQLSTQLNGIYVFSREQNGFIGSSHNSNNSVETKDFTFKFTKFLNFHELNHHDVLNYFRQILYKKLKVNHNLMNFSTNNFYFRAPINNEKSIKFEGFNIVYKILSNRKIVMSLDISNKFFNSKSLMEEFKDNSKRNEFITNLGKLGKVTLFYELNHGRIINADKLSAKKPLDILIDNQNLIDYIKSTNSNLKNIDNEQYVLESKGYNYLSQFLHNVYDIKTIKNKVMLTPSQRYNKIGSIIKNYNLDKIGVDNDTISFNEMELDQSNIPLKKPELLFNNKVGKKSQILENLKSGFCSTKYIKNLYIYSDLDNRETNLLYNKFAHFSSDNYRYVLPVTYNNLENTPNELRNQLQKINPDENAVIVITHKEAIYKQFANTKLVFKALYPENAKKMLKYNSRSMIDNFLLSLYARLNCKPWLLKELNYNNYVFSDVSRGVAKYMAYTLIRDKNSNMEIIRGQPQKGESLSEDNLGFIFDTFTMENRRSVIYVRDGSISKSEFEMIKNKYIDNFDNIVVMEYQKTVNYRLFSKKDNEITKPKNGTCIGLDENNYVMVTTGYDEYKNLRGTPTTKSIKITILKGSYNRNKILADLFSMCFLNWVSPLNNFSDPAPIHYMDNLLNDMGKTINRSFIPY